MRDIDENLDFEDLEIVSNTESVINDEISDNSSDYKDSDNKLVASDILSTLTKIEAPITDSTKVDYKVVEPNGHVFINYHLLSHHNLLRDKDLKYFMKHLFMKKYETLFKLLKNIKLKQHFDEENCVLSYAEFTGFHNALCIYNLEIFLCPAKASKLDYSNVDVHAEAEVFLRALFVIFSNNYHRALMKSSLKEIIFTFLRLANGYWCLTEATKNYEGLLERNISLTEWFDVIKIIYAEDSTIFEKYGKQIKDFIFTHKLLEDRINKLGPKVIEMLHKLQGKEFIEFYCQLQIPYF